MIRCVECHNEIDHLNYSEPVVEYGSCELDGDSFDRDGSDENGSITYSCPECSYERHDPEDIWEEVDDDEEEEEEENGTIIREEQSRGGGNATMGSYISNQNAVVPCSECRQPTTRGMVCACRED